MSSLRDGLARLGHSRDRAFSYRKDLSHVRPQRLSELLRASQDPRLEEWVELARSSAENTPFSEEAQGAIPDGGSWYFSSNGNDSRDGVYRLDSQWRIEAKAQRSGDTVSQHIGAPCVADGWIYVPVQPSDSEGAPRGIWKLSIDFARSVWLEAQDLPDGNLFSWCDLHQNGLLYTCDWDHPQWLRAYDARPEADGRLERVPDRDIALVSPPDRPSHCVQGACFTPNHRVLVICDEDGDERIHCHSTLTGAFMGRRTLLAEVDETQGLSAKGELESIVVRAMVTATGMAVHVHVLELDNDDFSGDDVYLHHLCVPRPDVL